MYRDSQRNDVNPYWGCEKMADTNGFVIVNGVLFWHCGKNYPTVAIPYGVKEIAPYAFKYSKDSRGYNGSIREIIIPSSVESIGSCAFIDCANLKKLHIGNSETKIGDNILEGCYRIEEIIVPKNASQKLKELSREIERKLQSKKQEEEQKKKEEAKRNIKNEQDLRENVSAFIQNYSKNEKSAEEIIKYILAKLGETIYDTQGNWYFYSDKIMYSYYSSCCSFFDDGGGRTEGLFWKLQFVEKTEINIDNRKLDDLGKYKHYKGDKERFACNNPFGLSGLFEISYESYREEM